MFSLWFSSLMCLTLLDNDHVMDNPVAAYIWAHVPAPSLVVYKIWHFTDWSK